MPAPASPSGACTSSAPGINATVLVHNNDKVIAIYGTPYELGQMVALKMPDVVPTNAAAGPVVLERKALWSCGRTTSPPPPVRPSSSATRSTWWPRKGDLCAVNANTGAIEWKLKVGIEQRNSCPLFADGKLYVPILDDPDTKAAGTADAGTTGGFYIIKPTRDRGRNPLPRRTGWPLLRHAGGL